MNLSARAHKNLQSALAGALLGGLMASPRAGARSRRATEPPAWRRSTWRATQRAGGTSSAISPASIPTLRR